jgi:hypothetical protein
MKDAEREGLLAGWRDAVARVLQPGARVAP